MKTEARKGETDCPKVTQLLVEQFFKDSQLTSSHFTETLRGLKAAENMLANLVQLYSPVVWPKLLHLPEPQLSHL